MIKGQPIKKFITIINTYVRKNRTQKYMKELKVEINPTIIVGASLLPHKE